MKTFSISQALPPSRQWLLTNQYWIHLEVEKITTTLIIANSYLRHVNRNKQSDCSNFLLDRRTVDGKNDQRTGPLHPCRLAWIVGTQPVLRSFELTTPRNRSPPLPLTHLLCHYYSFVDLPLLDSINKTSRTNVAALHLTIIRLHLYH